MNDVPALLYDKGHSGRIRNDSYYYIHHFNIENLKTHISELKLAFKQVEENQFSSLIHGQFNSIEVALKKLNPARRVKRWNTIGTVWKFIAGTPDANDLKIINDSLNDLITNNNNQVRINREISLQMKEALFKTKDAIKLFNEKSAELYSINIYFNLKFLQEKLDDILETIMLTKLGILNERILSVNEAEKLTQDLLKENLPVFNIAEALTYAATSIATNEREIALLIKLPKLDPRVFRKVLILPTWFNGKQVHINHRNYLHYGDQCYIVDDLQKNIFDQKEVTLDNSSCVPYLFTGNTATCDYLADPREEIITIDNQHILINLHKNFTLQTNCGNITRRNLFGTYMVSYSNCEITVNNQRFSNSVQNITGNAIFLPLNGVSVGKGNPKVDLSLEHLHNLHLETRKKLEAVRLNNSSIQWPQWSLFGGLAIPYIIIAIVVICKFLTNRSTTIEVKHPEVSPRFKAIAIQDILRTEPQS